MKNFNLKKALLYICVILTLNINLINSINALTFLQNNKPTKPIIGIFCNVSPPDSETTITSMIYYYNVLWLESAGFKVLPIYFNYSKNKLDKLLPKLNGILYQGGDRVLKEKKGVFELNGFYIIDKAIDYKIPVFFICQGFQFLHFYFNKSLYIYNKNKLLEDYSAWSITLPSQVVEKNIERSKLFKYFSKDDIVNLYSNKQTPSTVQYHHFGISEDAYKNVKSIRENLIITSYGYDKDNKKFVNTAESSDFTKNRFLAVQFHPEIAMFAKDKESIDLSNLEALEVSQKILLAFKHQVNEYIDKVKDPFISESQEKEWGVFDSTELALKEGEDKYYFNNQN